MSLECLQISEGYPSHIKLCIYFICRFCHINKKLRSYTTEHRGCGLILFMDKDIKRTISYSNKGLYKKDMVPCRIGISTTDIHKHLQCE